LQPEPEPEPEAIEPPELCVWRVPPALLAEVLALRRQVCVGRGRVSLWFVSRRYRIESITTHSSFGIRFVTAAHHSGGWCLGEGRAWGVGTRHLL
jgi:hypothetical protein